MSYINRKIFELAYTSMGRKEIAFYNNALRLNELSYDEQIELQNENLRRLIQYSYNNVPYYNKLFKLLNLHPQDIDTKDDLYKLPILNKEIIRNNYNDFFPPKPFSSRYFNCTTGGSTGTSLKYRCSEECYSLGVALMYRGWGYSGYKIGDSVFFFGGGSIIKGEESYRAKLSYKLRNLHPYSSLGVSNDDFKLIIERVRRLNPSFFRGYASSLYLLARFVEDSGGINKIGIRPPVAVFTTAEMLYPKQREVIESVMQTKVYNNYGLNDGGVSAYEHHGVGGLLIDTERSILECVNMEGHSVINQEGRILATSLFNYDFPFIRYDTGDLGVVSDEYLLNGGKRLILKALLGRATDFLEVNEKKIGSPALTVIMGKTDAHKYQIIQRGDLLRILIDRGDTFDDRQEQFIRSSLESYLGKVKLSFEYTDQFVQSNNKHKFIIKEKGL